LFALGIFNLFLVAAEVELFKNSETGKLSTNSLWMMAVINWMITVIVIMVMTNVMGHQKMKRPTPVPSPLANMEAEAD
jgi:hypothetical protein